MTPKDSGWRGGAAAGEAAEEAAGEGVVDRVDAGEAATGGVGERGTDEGACCGCCGCCEVRVGREISVDGGSISRATSAGRSATPSVYLPSRLAASTRNSRTFATYRRRVSTLR